MLLGPPDQTDKLGLVGVAPIAFRESRFHLSIIEVAQFAKRTCLSMPVPSRR